MIVSFIAVFHFFILFFLLFFFHFFIEFSLKFLTLDFVKTSMYDVLASHFVDYSAKSLTSKNTWFKR